MKRKSFLTIVSVFVTAVGMLLLALPSNSIYHSGDFGFQGCFTGKPGVAIQLFFIVGSSLA